MFAPLSIHLDSLKKVFYDKNELMRSGIELNKNFLIYTNENENKDFFVGYLSNIDDGTGFEISAGLFLNRRISVPRTILEKTFLGNIELSDSLGFDGTKLKVITLDTLEATLEEEGLPASAKAIKLLKQEIDSFVAGNLQPATIKTIGGVIVGDGIEVDVEGTIRTPKSKNTKGSDIISNTGTTFLLNTGINVLNRNIDFDIEFSIINPSDSATKLFVSGSHIYVESTLSNFKGFSDGNITSVKGFVKDNLLHIYIENLCTSIVCDKIDVVDRDYPNNAVFVNKPFINKQELPIVDILKETVLNLKVMLFGINSVNDGLTVNADNIQLNVQNVLTSTSTTQPLSANQGRVLDLLKRDKTDRVFENGLQVSQGQYLQFDDRVNNMVLNMYKGHNEGQDINSIYNYISTGGSAKMFDERNCPISKTPSGWCKLANGLIVQWGSANGTVDVAFPISFSYPPQVITSGAVVDTAPIYQTLSGCEIVRTNNFKLVSYGFTSLGETGSGINNSSYKGISSVANFGGPTRWLAIGY